MNEYPIKDNILGQLERDHSKDFGEFNLEGCSICRELDHEKNIIDSTANFSCFPDIGQIMEGYVQIVTKKHQLSTDSPLYSTGHLPLDWMREYEEFSEEIRQRVEKTYGQTIQFEHGENGETKERQGRPPTVHMHLHIVPTRESILDQINSSGLFDISNLNDLRDLSGVIKRKSSYFYYRDIDGQGYLLDPKGPIPSQTMRKYLNKIHWVVEENKKWLAENGSKQKPQDLWECMSFRPADRFKSTIENLR